MVFGSSLKVIMSGFSFNLQHVPLNVHQKKKLKLGQIIFDAHIHVIFDLGNLLHIVFFHCAVDGR